MGIKKYIRTCSLLMICLIASGTVSASPDDDMGLIEAAGHGDKRIFDMLLAMGGNPRVVDKGGNSALLMAAYYGRRDMVRRLINLHGDNNINVLGSIGYTPLGVAAMRDDDEIMKMLIQAGAKPDVYDQAGDTPLLNAIRLKRDRNLAILLDAGADPDLAGDLGVTPLMAAAQIGRLDYVDMLLESNAYPSARDNDGSTALYYAIFYGYNDVAKRLIKSGAVLYGLNNGYTVLHWARVMGMKDVVAMMESAGAVN